MVHDYDRTGEGHDYDRTKSAGTAFFNNFQALPKRATAGTSLSPVMVSVTSSEYGYTANFDLYGDVRGGMQEVVDEMRLTMLDIHQMTLRFFRETVLSNCRIMEQGREDVIVSKEHGLHLHTYVTFTFDTPVEPSKLRALLEQAAKIFGSVLKLTSVQV